MLQRRRQHGLFRVQKWRAVAYGAGILTLFIALISPVDSLVDLLFSVHMVQHILLMDLAAPLLAFSAPLGPLLNAFPHTSQQAVGRWWSRPHNWLKIFWRWLSHPITAWVLFAGLLWAWHIPVFYMAAVENNAIHAVEHFCFLGSGMLFWWNIFYVLWRKPQLRGLGVFYMALYALQGSGLGALLLLSNVPWYPIYASSSKSLGISPLADQQMAGAIMGLPEAAIYMVGALIMLKGWLESLEHEEESKLENVASLSEQTSIDTSELTDENQLKALKP